MAVFVLDKRKRPLMPCAEKRARQLLDRGQAVVHTLRPFTIRLKHRVGGETQPVEIRLDPGSKATGVAVVRTGEEADSVLHLAELAHRGAQIRDALASRASLRRTRRGRKTRYRKARFLNRPKPAGWLPPSLRHRVESTLSYVRKLARRLPAACVAAEIARFDTRLMQDPDACGLDYQQGALSGYEVREYVLQKWGRRCAYCGAENVPFQIDHVVPRSRGGSDRASNLTLACGPCNQAKGNAAVADFLAGRPEALRRITAELKAPLRDAAAMNATRNGLLRALRAEFGAVGTFTGGRTKWNRTRLGVPKTHALDAACVGVVPDLTGWDVPVLRVRCTGRGTRQRVLPDRYGFARGHRPRKKTVHGFATGDLVSAVVPEGKKAGTWTGRVAVRTSGSFNVKTAGALIQGVHHRHFRILQRGDGHDYVIKEKRT